MNTLVLGLGNTLLGDEGVGVHIVEDLRRQYADLNNVSFLDGGTLSFTLASYIEDTDNLIIIDAAQLNRSYGAISLYEGEEMDKFVSSNRNKSVHEVNVTDILALAHLTDKLPVRRALIGIQPQIINWSDSLSDAVVQAVPKVCNMTFKLISRWQHDSKQSLASAEQ